MAIKRPFVFEIAYRTWCIDEFGLDNLFLLEGRDKALLIDTGTGVFDIPALVRELTDKPLIVAATHGHLDHVGGMGMFSEIYLHPDDWKLAREVSGKERQDFVALMMYVYKDRYDMSPERVLEGPLPRMLPLREGDIFHLGGRDVQVYETPGHTPGGLSFLDVRERLLFTGDACNPNILLAPREKSRIEPKSDIRTLLATARKIEGLHDSYDRNYNGHVGGPHKTDYLPMPEGLTRDCIAACEGLLEGSLTGVESPNELFRSEGCLVAKYGEVEIKYYPEQLK